MNPRPTLNEARLPGVRRWVQAHRPGSTQDVARKLAEEGSPSWTLVTAESQAKGRGRLGRPWSSGKGGLYLTLLLRPRASPEGLGAMNLGAARAVARAVARQGVFSRVDPPNDVLASADGKGFRKVAGILAEAASRGRVTDWLLVGIGVNANNRLPRTLRSAATLRALLGRRVDLGRLLKDVVRELRGELEGR